jgi:ribosomal protein S18 acetylase RimI-like enzyme
VTAAYRRRGIARELVAAISSALFAKGAEQISALVEYEHEATGFWDSLESFYQRDPKFIRYIADRERSPHR